MNNKLQSSSKPWHLIIPAASTLLVAVIGLASTIYQTDKPVQLTMAAMTAQSSTLSVLAAQATQAVQAAVMAVPTASQPAPAAAQAAPTATPATSGRDGGPSVMVSNKLVRPVKIFVDGALKLDLEPGGLEAVSLGAVPASVRWSVVKLTTDKGLPLGSDMGGTFNNVKAGDELSIASQAGNQPYFYPIVSNTSSKDCSVTINNGWTDEIITGVVIPSRQEDFALGYYPLFSYSNVTLECGGQFYWWGLRPNEKNQTSIYYQVPKDTGVIRVTMH